jgi:hypothetical protein
MCSNPSHFFASVACHLDWHCPHVDYTTQSQAAAIEALATETPAVKSRLSLLQIDTSSDESVLAAAATHGTEDTLYAICNNAGIAGGALGEVRLLRCERVIVSH